MKMVGQLVQCCLLTRFQWPLRCHSVSYCQQAVRMDQAVQHWLVRLDANAVPLQQWMQLLTTPALQRTNLLMCDPSVRYSTLGTRLSF